MTFQFFEYLSLFKLFILSSSFCFQLWNIWKSVPTNMNLHSESSLSPLISLNSKVSLNWDFCSLECSFRMCWIVCVCVCCRWGWAEKWRCQWGKKNLFSPFNVVVDLTHLLVMTNVCVGVEVSDKSWCFKADIHV